MVKSKRFWCIPLDGGSNEVFAVDIGLDQPVFDLKVMIKASLNRMRQYDAQDIPLYKLNEPVLVAPAATLLQRIKAQGEIEDIAVKMKEPSESLGDVFPGGVADRRLHILVKFPMRTQAPEDEPGPPFKRARLTSPDEIPDWLQELHKKIWNRKDLRQELFRSVTLTLTDYNRLQESMTKLYLNVQEEDCWNGTAGVVTARLAALQSSNNCLVTDHGPHRIVQPINHNDDQTEGDDEVDEELGSLFPFALEYLDLSSLNLQSPPPCMPMPLLIRKEYHILSKMLNDLPQDGRGSAIITGQPGIGKTAYLYYRLIQSMLAGTRCLFQPIRNEKHENTVYLIAESSIEVVNSWSTEGVVAFFDADGPSPRPAQFIIDNHYIKIIGACLPNVADEKWTTKMGNGAVLNRIVTTLWSRQELYITGMFLAVPHLPYSRLQELTTYFGFNPRTCFNARLKPHYLLDYLGSIEKKIDETAKKTSLESIWRETCSRKSISHSIFQISPKDDRRMLSQVTTAAISPWALTTLLKIYEHRQADASFEFYNMIKDLPDEGTIRGQIFQVQLLKRLNALKGRERFTIRCLIGSNTSQWMYPGPTENSFSYSSTFPHLLEDAVTQQKSVHLVPQDPDFPAISILYIPGDVLTVIHVTVETEHPVAVVDLERIESWLKRACILANLRPSILGNHWRLIFVVPEQIASTFHIQRYEGDRDSNEWFEKVDQHVLGIEEHALWGRSNQLPSCSEAYD